MERSFSLLVEVLEMIQVVRVRVFRSCDGLGS